MADRIRRRQGMTYSLDNRKSINPKRKIYANGALLDKMNSASGEAAKSAFGGANSTMGSISGVLGAAGTMLDTFNKNAEIADTSGIQSNIDEVTANTFEDVNDYASILDADSDIQALKDDYTGQDVRGDSTGERITNTLGAVAAGASAGASVGGPWGAVAGAALGLGSGIAGWITGGEKAKKEAERLNQEAQFANMKQQNSYNTKIETLNSRSWKDSMANIAAHGGPLSKKTLLPEAYKDRIIYEDPDFSNAGKPFEVPNGFGYLVLPGSNKVSAARQAIGTGHSDWQDWWNKERLSTGNYDIQLGDGKLEQQKKNRDTALFTYTPDYATRYLKYMNMHQAGYYNPETHQGWLGNTAMDNNSAILEHEIAHASQAVPQWKVIGDIIGNDSQKVQDETYARLMELRKALNLDPKRKYNRKDINLMRKSSYKNPLLDKYDDKTMERLLNEVASTSNMDYIDYAAEGGKIYIKPSKRGTFTAVAKKRGMEVQEFARKVLANKDSYSPAMVKKANFARNFGGRKHDLGGYLFTHGADWNNGVTKVNAGGPHEMNPYDGVPMGIAPDNQPNLVEQGEVIYNDYVFSNRLNPDKKDLKKAGLPENYKNSSFAYIAEDMAKESEERPNDPISKRGLEDSLGKLAAVQEMQRQRKGKKGTQQMMSYGGRKYAGIYDNPPIDFSIPTGPSNFSTEFPIYYPGTAGNSEVLPEGPLFVPKAVSSTTTVKQTKPVSKASEPVKRDMELVPKLNRIEDPDFISNSDISHIYTIDNTPRTVTGYKLPDTGLAKGTTEAVAESSRQDAARRGLIDNNDDSLLTYLRYAPVLGSALGALYTAFQKPDYSNANLYFQEAANLPRETVQARTLNNYLAYKPLDRNYYLNQLKGQAGATRRSIMNSGSNPGQVMANLLAADYNAQNAVGNTLMQMDRYNQEQKERVAGFNRGTDQYNAQALMQTDAQNAGLAMQRAAMRSDLINRGILLREQADQALEASRNMNFTNLFDNLGGIGRENFAMNQVNSGNWSAEYDENGRLRFKSAKNGGMLTKKNRRKK